MRKRVSLKMAGFTLVEILLSIAVIVLLAGLVYAGLAPVRERAREVHCLNNLRQISRAIQMYRQDYGGGEPPSALTVAQLGLPTRPRLLEPYLGGDWSVFRCPSEDWGEGVAALRSAHDSSHRRVSYMWHIRPDEAPWPAGYKRFSQQVALRGNDTPLATDPHHGTLLRGKGDKTERLIILRLGGQVELRIAPIRGASWEK